MHSKFVCTITHISVFLVICWVPMATLIMQFTVDIMVILTKNLCVCKHLADSKGALHKRP